MTRRLPPPWRAEKFSGGYVVRDASKADQRVDQFVRLRDAIEERTSRKFFEGPRETEGPVVLRSNDFFK
jgi:hypothetical protein